MNREDIIPNIDETAVKERMEIDPELMILVVDGYKLLLRYRTEGLYSIIASIDCEWPHAERVVMLKHA